MKEQLTIVRDGKHPISIEEWQQYLQTRNDIERPTASVSIGASFSDILLHDKRVVLKNPGFARCTLPHGSKSGRTGIFNLRHGSIVFEYVKGPVDEHAITELKAIAMSLNARVLDAECQEL